MTAEHGLLLLSTEIENQTFDGKLIISRLIQIDDQILYII